MTKEKKIGIISCVILLLFIFISLVLVIIIMKDDKETGNEEETKVEDVVKEESKEETYNTTENEEIKEETEILEEKNKVYEVDNSNKDEMIDKATELLERIEKNNEKSITAITFFDLNMDGILELCVYYYDKNFKLYGESYEYKNNKYVEYKNSNLPSMESENFKVYKQQDNDYIFWLKEFTSGGGATEKHYLNYLSGAKELIVNYEAIVVAGEVQTTYYDGLGNSISKEEYDRTIEKTRSKLSDMNIKYEIKNIKDKEVKNCLLESYDGYVVGRNIENSESNETINISVEEANEIMNNYIISEDYKNFIDEFYFNYGLEYVIKDLNADGFSEILVQSDFDAPFYYTWLFVLEGENVVLVNENYGYGEYRYSPKHNAILVSPETKPFSGTGATPFYKLEGMVLKKAFVVGEDVGNAFYSDDSGRKSITQEERSAYFEDVVDLEFQKLN